MRQPILKWTFRFRTFALSRDAVNGRGLAEKLNGLNVARHQKEKIKGPFAHRFISLSSAHTAQTKVER